jgi:CRISPR-associated protein (TIGR02584 family)
MTPPRRILLAVAGTTPATQTEAVWALAVDNKRALDAVRVLTTSAARAQIEPGLAEALALMRRDYPKAGIPKRIEWRVAPLADIRSSDDNEALADWMLGEVRAACSESGCEVHASLAGGRKTMSFYLGAAMQLCGRTQDRLYHVLVPSEFEVPGFLFPRAKSSKANLLTTRDGATLDPSKARVDLAEVPFVRLSPLLDSESVQRLTFHDLTARASDALSDEYGDVEVRVPETGKSGKALIRITPPFGPTATISYRSAATREFLVYTWLLSRQKRGLPPLVLKDESRFQDQLDDLVLWCEQLGLPGREIDAYRNLERDLAEARRDDLRKEVDKDHVGEFFEYKWYEPMKFFPSRLRTKFEEAFQKQAPGYDPTKYQIRSEGVEGGRSGWYLNIPAEKIHLPANTPRRGKQ